MSEGDRPIRKNLQQKEKLEDIFYRNVSNLIVLPTIVLVQDFSERIFSDHHVEVGRVQLLAQVQDHRVRQVTVAACQRFAQGTRLLLKLKIIGSS